MNFRTSISIIHGIFKFLAKLCFTISLSKKSSIKLGNRALVIFPEGLGDTFIYRSHLLELLRELRPCDVVTHNAVSTFFDLPDKTKRYSMRELTKINLDEYREIHFINPNLKPSVDRWLRKARGDVYRTMMLPSRARFYKPLIKLFFQRWHINFDETVNSVAPARMAHKSPSYSQYWLICTHSSVKSKHLSVSFISEILKTTKALNIQVDIVTEHDIHEQHFNNVRILRRLDLEPQLTALNRYDRFIGIDSFISHLARVRIPKVNVIGELGNKSIYRYDDIDYLDVDLTCFDCQWACYQAELFQCLRLQEKALQDLIKDETRQRKGQPK